jgi:hypothetical protein
MLKIIKDSLDYSLDLESYTTGSESIPILDGESILIGYYKPINALFIEQNTITHNSQLSIEYWNGAWVELDFKDYTNSLKNSGFLKWERNQDGQKKNTLAGLELFWYRLKLVGDNQTITFKGINLNFSDDSDLKEEYPNIMDHLPDGAVSFVNFHQAARKDIITYFRNQGKFVNSQEPKKVDQFDLLDFEEVREASKFLVLHKIFMWLSDSIDDKWYQKANDFAKKYSDKINLFYLSLDDNDDGLEDASEKMAIKSVRIIRQ